MKEHLATLIADAPTPVHARSIAREYLQARILETLQRAGAFVPLAFHGGTALRFLFATPRYSEDLDFALERAHDQYAFRAYLQAIERALEAEGYSVALKVNDQRTVHSAFVRFPGLLSDLQLSPHPEEALAIKLEVDTNPPSGAGLETTVVRRHVILQLQHHDRASLLAGKLHAVLERPLCVKLKGVAFWSTIWSVVE